MKKHILVLLLLAVFLTGCGTVTRHNHIVLIDNSRSVSSETWNRYIRVIAESIMKKMQRFDSIVILFIDDCSMSKSERVYSLNLAGMNFSKTGDGMNNEKDSMEVRLNDTITAQINQMIEVIRTKRQERKSCGNFTDIVNAISEAAKLLNKDSNYASTFDMIVNSFVGEDSYRYENSLILLSDMINENKEGSLSFRGISDFSERQILEKVESISTKVTDLENCKIFVYGATSTLSSGTKANSQIENIKLFWTNFFKRCNGNLVAYSFDSEREIAAYVGKEEH